MIAFHAESEAIEKCPRHAIAGLRDGRQASAFQLNEGIGENAADGPTRRPSRRRCRERDLNVAAIIVVREDGAGDQIGPDRDADRAAPRPEIIDAESGADPARHRLVMADDQHQTALPGSTPYRVEIHWISSLTLARTRTATSMPLPPATRQRASTRCSVAHSAPSATA